MKRKQLTAAGIAATLALFAAACETEEPVEEPVVVPPAAVEPAPVAPVVGDTMMRDTMMPPATTP